MKESFIINGRENSVAVRKILEFLGVNYIGPFREEEGVFQFTIYKG